MANFPADLLYTKEHEWIRIADGVGTVGITEFAAEQLGDVTMVELPTEGDTFDKDQVFGTVESVKAVSDLFSPVSGKITKVNDPINDTPEYVNEAPYEDGWLVEIQLTNDAEVADLMNAEAYEAFVAEQE